MNEPPRYERLEVWRLAHELVLGVYALAKTLPPEERFRLVDQLCPAAVSVPANIAEGDGRQASGDQVRFLHIARGSLAETRYLLRLAADLGYLTPANTAELHELASKLHAKLCAFIASIRPPA